jgi:ATP-binding cassette subfamily C protein CydD
VLLQGADFDLPAGRHVALIGPSGIGKSSLLLAIAGVRRYEGSLRLGGEEVSGLDRPALLERVAMVPQRPVLLARSIADNIRLGRPDATDADVRRAAGRALVTPFADTLPAGLDTVLGEGGFGLSGGQAHRVGIARLYLRDPSVILLDEPTAHLDPFTEAALLDNLLAFAKDRTLFIVTHAPAVAARIGRAWRLAGLKLLPAPVPQPPAFKAERGAA